MIREPSKKLYESFHSITKKHRQITDISDFTHGPILKKINKFMPEHTKHILNIGCGTGSIDFHLAKKGYSVTGIDISAKAINSCRKSAEYFKLENNTTFIESTLEKFKPSIKFNLILMIEVIEHIKNDQEQLCRMSKFIDKNGVLILSTPSINAPLFKLGFLDNFDNRVGHIRRYRLTEMQEMLRKCNFKIIDASIEEGIVRNFLFTSTIGTKLLLRITNKFRIFQRIIELLDKFSLNLIGGSDIIIVAKKQ